MHGCTVRICKESGPCHQDVRLPPHTHIHAFLSRHQAPASAANASSGTQVPAELCPAALLGDGCCGAWLPAMHCHRNILLLPGASVSPSPEGCMACEAAL